MRRLLFIGLVCAFVVLSGCAIMTKSVAEDLLARLQGQETRIAHMRGQLAAYQRVAEMQGDILSRRAGCGRTTPGPDEFVVPERPRPNTSTTDLEEPYSCNLPDAGPVSTDAGAPTDASDASVRRRPLNTP